MSMELGYWGLKGVAEPIRWLVAYTKAPVTEYNPASKEEWFDTKKAQVGGEFPNLPYLIDGDFKLTESSAIPSYIAKKTGHADLVGKNIQDEARVRQIEGVLGDIRQNIFKALFGHADEATAKAAVHKAFEATGATAAKFDQLSKFLGAKDYFLGYLTWVDFQFAYVAELTAAVSTSLGVDCPACKHENLGNLCKRVHALDGVKARYEASKSIPFMPPMFPFKLLTTAEMEAKWAEKGHCADKK
jgi:glutathione S-transferase